jgi:SAM-dependent methyltransferase
MQPSNESPGAILTPTLLEALTDRRVLHLGCGVRPVEGAINHDRIKHAEHVDIAFDLDVVGGNRHLNWPIPDGRFSKVIALDVFEHLRADIDVWLRECWRILDDDGRLILRVSAWDNPVSYRDPTHHRVFHDETFHFFDPSQPLWADYGRIYFPDGPWFAVELVERGNADPRYRVGDICAVLRKVKRPEIAP